jgi:hypothetical protein
MQIKHHARKLIEKLPAGKGNERNFLRNNMINLLLHLQIRHHARKLIEKLPAGKRNERDLLRNNAKQHDKSITSPADKTSCTQIN